MAGRTRRATLARPRALALLMLPAAVALALDVSACSRGQTPAATGAESGTATGGTTAGGAARPTATTRATEGAMIRLKTHRVVDAQGIGFEAFSLLIPAGWETDGGILWPLRNPAMPAEVSFRAFDPHSADGLEVFPARACTFNPALLGMFPVGSFYLGSEVREPMDARQALRTMVIARHRGGVAHLRVTGEAEVPDLKAIAEQAAAHELRQGGIPGARALVTAAKVRVEYDLGG
ncbi:MAG: hypothetical protein FJ313_05960, partial [Gemmatimonadetes bacterium]|nr:hypothetical protein [Gemmatimonadota bacterium]